MQLYGVVSVALSEQVESQVDLPGFQLKSLGSEFSALQLLKFGDVSVVEGLSPEHLLSSWIVVPSLRWQ